jgi:hypothetical protein
VALIEITADIEPIIAYGFIYLVTVEVHPRRHVRIRRKSV